MQVARPVRSRRASRRDGIADVGGLLVGHWRDEAAATGCTVVLTPPDGAVAAASVRGGAPGTRETDLLAPGNLVQRIHAVLLTGGSAFGLNAAAGVMRYLEERTIGFETRGGRVPIVVGAVLYDLGVGDGSRRPGEAEGYAACVAAAADPPADGSVGAGTGATVAKGAGIERAWKGGVGSAAERLADGTVVAALVAVNAYGDIVDPDSGARIASPRAATGGTSETAIEILRRRGSRSGAQFTSTTLAVVATSAPLDRAQLQRVAEMAHAGIARAIEPSHAPGDGDAVFALALGSGRRRRPPDLTAIGALGARAVSRAIVRGVLAATGLAGVPAVSETHTPPDRVSAT
jgi:L-aminopeptidase/D-esterase-like protein